MSQRFEAEIQNWYDHRSKHPLTYLDLATDIKPSPVHSCLLNNLVVTYDRLSLHSRLEIKHHYLIRELLEKNIDELRKENRQLKARLTAIESELKARQPLTKAEVRSLVQEIAAQPKLIEEQSEKLLKEVQKQVKDLREALNEVRTYTIG
ncbi:hypothetical protein [Lucky bamboo bacilliform virus]|nr:hypothetical protein [Lucky bamboo bacilliform virus]